MPTLLLASATGLGAGPAPQSLDFFDLILHQASPVDQVVIVLLVALSLVSWFIIAYKFYYLWTAAGESKTFLDAFWQTKRLDELYATTESLPRSPVAQLYRAGFVELSKLQQQEQSGAPPQVDDLQNVERALNRARTSESTHLESMVPFLATTGSASPFIGLFGTVIGIMNSFRSIGAQGSAGVNTVAGGIAEALITTAIGLVAAIPAVMAYNYFTRKLRVHASEMEAFTNDFLNIVKRHFFK